MKKGDSIETISTLVDLYRAFTNTQGPPLVHSRLAARPVWSQSRPQAAPPPGRAAVGAWAVQLRLRARHLRGRLTAVRWPRTASTAGRLGPLRGADAAVGAGSPQCLGR